jgi:serine/threonine-protein phosphatase PGAM5
MARVGPERADRCREQLEHAFATYFVPSSSGDRHDIIVCHGNVIRYFITRVLEVDPQAWLSMTVGNCGLTVVRIKADGDVRLLSYNDVGHLPVNLQTHTGSDNSGRYLAVPPE